MEVCLCVCLYLFHEMSHCLGADVANAVLVWWYVLLDKVIMEIHSALTSLILQTSHPHPKQSPLRRGCLVANLCYVDIVSSVREVLDSLRYVFVEEYSPCGLL